MREKEGKLIFKKLKWTKRRVRARVLDICIVFECVLLKWPNKWTLFLYFLLFLFFLNVTFNSKCLKFHFWFLINSTLTQMTKWNKLILIHKYIFGFLNQNIYQCDLPSMSLVNFFQYFKGPKRFWIKLFWQRDHA